MKEYVGVGRLQLKVRIVYISRIVVDVPFSSMVLFTFFFLGYWTKEIDFKALVHWRNPIGAKPTTRFIGHLTSK